MSENVSTTLNAAHEQPIVITAHQNASGDVHIASEMTGTIVANASVSRQQIICVGSDSSKPAVDVELCSTLHVGGGCSMNSDTVGALCARDFKGVGSQYVEEGKVICQRTC